ncbi:MAG: LPS biosynthesis protein WbpP [Gemmatimonadetes bacterium]|nr:MAG: LPS biosynthesis protein WbpP [Gemmatimonadota bacterium]
MIERVDRRDRELHGPPHQLVRHLLPERHTLRGAPQGGRVAGHASGRAGRIPARGKNQADHQGNDVRFLITGGAGFIGSHLVEHFVAAGHDVTVLDDLSSGRRANLAAVRRAIRFIRGSVTDLNTCRRAVEGVDCVLHHAAVTSVQQSVDEPLVTHTVNATGTLNVLLAARDKGVSRVVYAGSTSAYGNTATLPNSEEQVSRPLSPYAASKLAGEEYCVAFHATYGLETVVLRYFNVFGPRQDPNSQYAAVVPRFIAAALAGERPTIFGDGGQTRDFVYIANVVHANVLATAAPAAGVAGQVFNVGCGQGVSVNQLWERVRTLAGVPLVPVYTQGRAGEVRDSVAALAKARRLVGYEPIVDFEEGLRQTIAFYRTGRETQPRKRARTVVAAA